MKWLMAFGLGSFAFWSPIVLFRVLLGTNWQIAGIAYTLLAPYLMCVVLQLFCERQRLKRPMVLWMLFGIWATGVLWNDVVMTFDAGEGFHRPGALAQTAWMTLFFPATTFMISTYDGMLFALLVTTLIMIVFSFTKFRLIKPTGVPAN